MTKEKKERALPFECEIFDKEPQEVKNIFGAHHAQSHQMRLLFTIPLWVCKLCLIQIGRLLEKVLIGL
jgi:hypothetical protein